MVAAGKCGVSAPQQALSEHNRGCTSDKQISSDACVSAIHRFCWSVTFPEESGISRFKTLGVSKEHLPGKISISCIKAEWSDYVAMETLQKHEKHCTQKHGSQGRHCLAAIHRFCQATLGANYAGTSQEVNENNEEIFVQCFEPVRKEIVLHDTLKDYDHSCKSHDPSFQVHTDDCHVAANKWCQSVGHSGGIAQEADEGGVTVACYTDVFSNWAYVTRSSEFFAAEKQVDIVCSLDFDIKEGKIANQAPQFLKMEVYDNSGSSQTLYSSFTVSQQITEKSIFRQRRMFTISASSTANLEASLPYVNAGGSLTLSAARTKEISLTGENWTAVTYTEESRVEVAPEKAVVKEAVVTKAKLRVPWEAKVVTGLGHETTIDGEWRGVTTYNFQVKQIECDERLSNCPVRQPNHD
jgi:hypothetical protein